MQIEVITSKNGGGSYRPKVETWEFMPGYSYTDDTIEIALVREDRYCTLQFTREQFEILADRFTVILENPDNRARK